MSVTPEKQIKDLDTVSLQAAIRVIWEKIVDRQIALHPDNWQQLIDVYRGENQAREALISKINQVYVCWDGNLEPFFSMMSIASEAHKAAISRWVRSKKGATASCYTYHLTNKSYSLIYFHSNSAIEPNTVIHELTHAADDQFNIYDSKTDKEMVFKAQEQSKLYSINFKIGLSFLGVMGLSFAGLVLPEIRNTIGQEQVRDLSSALRIAFGGLLTSEMKALYNGLKYNRVGHEVKANNFAKEIGDETIPWPLQDSNL